MTLEEIIEFCSDEWNIRITFDYEVFHLLADASNFFKFVREAIFAWDCDVDKYETGELLSFESDGTTWQIGIKFDANSKSFIVSHG
jgi:hypothetical protein